MNPIAQQRKNAEKSAKDLQWFWFVKRTLYKSYYGLIRYSADYAMLLPDNITLRRQQVFDGILTKQVWVE